MEKICKVSLLIDLHIGKSSILFIINKHIFRQQLGVIVINLFSTICSLFESSQTLFWASFGLIDLENFELTGKREGV